MGDLVTICSPLCETCLSNNVIGRRSRNAAAPMAIKTKEMVNEAPNISSSPMSPIVISVTGMASMAAIRESILPVVIDASYFKVSFNILISGITVMMTQIEHKT